MDEPSLPKPVRAVLDELDGGNSHELALRAYLVEELTKLQDAGEEDEDIVGFVDTALEDMVDSADTALHTLRDAREEEENEE